jgi:hypothetical protein
VKAFFIKQTKVCATMVAQASACEAFFIKQTKVCATMVAQASACEGLFQHPARNGGTGFSL